MQMTLSARLSPQNIIHYARKLFQCSTRIVNNQMTRWLDDILTRWPDDHINILTRWLDCLITRWSDDKMARWSVDQMIRWPDDHIDQMTILTRWPYWPPKFWVHPKLGRHLPYQIQWWYMKIWPYSCIETSSLCRRNGLNPSSLVNGIFCWNHPESALSAWKL